MQCRARQQSVKHKGKSALLRPGFISRPLCTFTNNMDMSNFLLFASRKLFKSLQKQVYPFGCFQPAGKTKLQGFRLKAFVRYTNGPLLQLGGGQTRIFKSQSLPGLIVPSPVKGHFSPLMFQQEALKAVARRGMLLFPVA